MSAVDGRPRLREFGEEATVSLSLLLKLGAIAGRADEMTQPGGLPVSSAPVLELLRDPEVVSLREALDGYAQRLDANLAELAKRAMVGG